LAIGAELDDCLEFRDAMIYIDDIMRILTEIQDEQIEQLDELAARSKRSRAALIRDAIAAYLGVQRQSHGDNAFGLWGKRKTDGMTYQRKIRSEW
jgi:predicted transcriptional regulator